MIKQALTCLTLCCGVAALAPSSGTRIQTTTSPLTVPAQPLKKLPWLPEGYSKWSYESEITNEKHTVSYIAAGEKRDDRPSLLLIHGFGASLYHYRYNIPELSDYYKVYALDLLGFGQSDKPLIDYSGELWSEQVCRFIKEKVKGDCVVVGNSLGGYAALASAATFPEMIKGCVLVNAAGTFDSRRAVESAGFTRVAKELQKPHPFAAAVDSWMSDMKAILFRMGVLASFYITKQPMRIKQVLEQVYAVNPANVDDELIESIRVPAEHENAAEIFYRVIARTGSKRMHSFNHLLSKLSAPVLLMWGEKDPWISSRAADRIQEIHPSARRVCINAGHCPHDEEPEYFNSALINWMEMTYE